MTLAISKIVRYQPAVRFFMILFAAMAILLSASHAAPAGAHDGGPLHTASHTVDHEHGSSGDAPGGEQHDGHHHCPSAAAPDHGVAVGGDYFANSRFARPNMTRLDSTTQAPPLTPPKA